VDVENTINVSLENRIDRDSLRVFPRRFVRGYLADDTSFSSMITGSASFISRPPRRGHGPCPQIRSLAQGSIAGTPIEAYLGGLGLNSATTISPIGQKMTR
jgi:hypothetical protein